MSWACCPSSARQPPCQRQPQLRRALPPGALRLLPFNDLHMTVARLAKPWHTWAVQQRGGRPGCRPKSLQLLPAHAVQHAWDQSGLLTSRRQQVELVDCAAGPVWHAWVAGWVQLGARVSAAFRLERCVSCPCSLASLSVGSIQSVSSTLGWCDATDSYRLALQTCSAVTHQPPQSRRILSAWAIIGCASRSKAQTQANARTGQPKRHAPLPQRHPSVQVQARRAQGVIACPARAQDCRGACCARAQDCRGACCAHQPGCRGACCARLLGCRGACCARAQDCRGACCAHQPGCRAEHGRAHAAGCHPACCACGLGCRGERAPEGSADAPRRHPHGAAGCPAVCPRLQQGLASGDAGHPLRWLAPARHRRDAGRCRHVARPCRPPHRRPHPAPSCGCGSCCAPCAAAARPHCRAWQAALDAAAHPHCRAGQAALDAAARPHCRAGRAALGAAAAPLRRGHGAGRAAPGAAGRL